MGVSIVAAAAVVGVAAVALLGPSPGDARPSAAGSLAAAPASVPAGVATTALPKPVAWEPTASPCALKDPAITESSGVVVTKDLVVTHNDSGDTARFFVLDHACRTLAVRNLTGVTARDIEDAGRGPDPAGRMSLWLADIGDNRLQRATVALYAVPMPGATVSGVATVRATSYQLAYPDGPHNAEALLMDPATGAFGIVTKTLDTAWLYVPATPLQAGVVTPLRKAVQVPLVATDGSSGYLVTGGAVAWSANLVAVRTYTSLWVWRLTGHDLVGAFAGPPVTRQELPVQRQGESVGFSPDGSLWLTSEGRNQPVELLHR